MPTYFLHLHEGGIVVEDEEGMTFADDACARAAAVRAARDVLAGAVQEGRLPLDDRIVVTDDAGRTVIVVTLGAAVGQTDL